MRGYQASPPQPSSLGAPASRPEVTLFFVCGARWRTLPQSDRVRRWEERCVSAVAFNPTFAGRHFVPSARAVAEERLLLPCMIWGHALGKAGPQSSLHFRISELPAPLPATRLQIPVTKQLRGWPVIASGQCHQQERPSFNPA